MKKKFLRVYLTKFLKKISKKVLYKYRYIQIRWIFSLKHFFLFSESWFCVICKWAPGKNVSTLQYCHEWRKTNLVERGHFKKSLSAYKWPIEKMPKFEHLLFSLFKPGQRVKRRRAFKLHGNPELQKPKEWLSWVNAYTRFMRGPIKIFTGERKRNL